MRRLRAEKPKENRFRQINYPFIVLAVLVIVALVFVLRGKYAELKEITSRIDAGYTVYVGDRQLNNIEFTAKDILMYEYKIDDSRKQIRLAPPHKQYWEEIEEGYEPEPSSIDEGNSYELGDPVELPSTPGGMIDMLDDIGQAVKKEIRDFEQNLDDGV